MVGVSAYLTHAIDSPFHLEPMMARSRTRSRTRSEKKGRLFVWSLAFACGAAATSAETVDRVLTVDREGTVRIHNPRGDVEVRGWDRSEVRVEGELDDLARDLVFEAEGDLTLVRVDLPRKNVNWGDGSDLTVRVPEASRILVDGLSSDIDVHGVRGELSIRTVSGDVDVDGIDGRTRIKTVSGDVDVQGGSGRLRVMTTSGNVEIDVDATAVFVDTITGDVELRVGRFETLVASSKNGALQLEGELDRAGALTARTVNSDIELELVPPVHASIEVVSVVSGDVDDDLTDAEVKRTREGRHVLSTVAGDGTGKVKLVTVNGAIEIR
jgi:DUF4097 and DUF4098 domain-containing protein YvlB